MTPMCLALSTTQAACVPMSHVSRTFRFWGRFGVSCCWGPLLAYDFMAFVWTLNSRFISRWILAVFLFNGRLEDWPIGITLKFLVFVLLWGWVRSRAFLRNHECCFLLPMNTRCVERGFLSFAFIVFVFLTWYIAVVSTIWLLDGLILGILNSWTTDGNSLWCSSFNGMQPMGVPVSVSIFVNVFLGMFWSLEILDTMEDRWRFW